MPYFAIYETASGNLISIAESRSIDDFDLRPTLSITEYANRIDLSNKMWDESIADFINRPAKVLSDRVDDLLLSSDYTLFQRVYNSLGPLDKQDLLDEIAKLLGGQRYRNTTEGTRL